IINNTVTNSEYGILLHKSNGTIVSGNVVSSNVYEGIELWPSSNNTVIGNNVTLNDNGILLKEGAERNKIVDNRILNNNNGINLTSSDNNIVANNTIESSSNFGIDLESSSKNEIVGNRPWNNSVSIRLLKSHENDIINNTISDSNIAGIRLYYSPSNTISGNNITANNRNGIVLRYSSNNTISENNIANNGYGIKLYGSSNYNSISGNSITANNGYGILLFDSLYNSISGNNIANNGYGIWLEHSSNYNSISGNSITANNGDGIWLYDSSKNSICGNTFTKDGLVVEFSYHNSVENNTVNGRPLVYLEGVSNRTVDDAGQVVLIRSDNIRVKDLNLSRTSVGVVLCETNNSIISGNNMANNGYGIWLWDSSNNSISGNSITANKRYGIWLYYSSNNVIYHNNFADNNQQVYSFYSTNVWDDGYPSGGNYWSDYTGTDLFMGPNQDQYGSDGIGDTPYVIDSQNRDNYPLMYPYGSPPPPYWNLTITTTTGGITEPPPGTYAYANSTTVAVTAFPQENYVFDHWELDGVNIGSENPVDVLMTANHTLHVVFLQVYKLTITTTLGGTTNPTPGAYNYTAETIVDVTAIPDDGYSFDYWLLDEEIKTENPITILMDSNHTLEAYFIDDIKPDISDPWQDPPSNNVQLFQNVTVWVNVTDYGTGVKNATLWYSTNNGTTWTILNMTALPIPSDTTITYEATIPGYENCTWITYKIIAYDKAGNNQTKDNNGYGYKYHVIPEFPSILILSTFMVISVIAVVFAKKTRYKKPKHSQSSPSFLRYSVSQSKM
ncbi:hypothetical protein DRO69_13480, partial [Candidatus Bathyarchaeota archaeon]